MSAIHVAYKEELTRDDQKVLAPCTLGNLGMKI